MDFISLIKYVLEIVIAYIGVGTALYGIELGCNAMSIKAEETIPLYSGLKTAFGPGMAPAKVIIDGVLKAMGNAS